MSKLGEISGVKAFLSDKEYSEYKGTLQAQLEEKDKEIEGYLEKIGQQDCKIMRAIEYCRLNKEFTPRLEDVENILIGGE